MSKKPRTDKVRKQDAARQQRKRDREAAHLARVGAETMKLTTYQGTRIDLELMQQVGGYEEPAEVITLAVRYMAGLARRDPAAFVEAMDPRNTR
ncbi:hypothetical protein [Stutzerimonas kirkiae]|uniref:hypothetical protein n=1 Tax=Stutzerimonas kirkiae TaxID=2211392 RepID=UPI001038401A|nr:hypothetical protein [Stutzerimonas kirkiae]TBV12775.1 hypothetical protein DNK01_13905 [Stutzerimonas kirkiae]